MTMDTRAPIIPLASHRELSPLDAEQIHHGWSWLKGPLTGLVGTGVLSWIGSLPWGSIITAAGAAAPVIVGTVIGAAERWDLFLHRRALRKLELQAARKRLKATPGEQVHPAEYEPPADPHDAEDRRL